MPYDLNLIETTEPKWQRLSAILQESSASLPAYQPSHYKKLVIVRALIANALVFVFQYLGLTLTTLTPHTLPLWFASGAAFAFIFMRGPGILPGIWLGSFFAYYVTNIPISIAALSASLFALQAFLLLWLSYTFVGPSAIFQRSKPFVIFLTLCLLITAACSFLLLLVIFDLLPVSVSFLSRWHEWWLANLNGIFIFGMAIISFDYYFPEMDALQRLPKRQLILLYSLLCLILMALLFMTSPLLTLLLASCMSLLILLVSLRYGWCGTMSASCLSGVWLTLADIVTSPMNDTAFAAATTSYMQCLLLASTVLGLLVRLK